MLTNEEKIKMVIEKISHINARIKSFIEMEEAAKGKYVLEDELAICNAQKQAFLKTLKNLGGTWEDQI